MEKEKIIITGSQHHRTWELDFSFVPSNEKEFTDFVENATWKVMKGCGFCIWDTVNKTRTENEVRPQDPVIIPTFEMDMTPSGIMEVEYPDVPTEKLSEDMLIILIPGEWYNSIPEGYKVHGLWSEEFEFEKGETDNDIRFGCLSFGILKPISFKEDEEEV